MDHSHNAHGAHSDGGHGSFGSYTTGFVLSVILTVAAFALVMNGTLTGQSALFAISGLALVQILVHLVFFLHINTAPDNTNNVLALAFGALIVMLIIVGSLWIMSNLSNNMTPMQMG